MSTPVIAFSDVDKTLVKGYSGFYTTLVLIQKGILKKRRLLQALYYRLKAPFLEGSNDAQEMVEKIYQIAVQDMAGARLDDILEIGRECFERWVRPRLYAEGVAKIKEHKKLGHKVYLISSGPYMTISSVAKFLEVDGHESSGPVIDEKGFLTAAVKTPMAYRRGKAVLAEKIVKGQGARWEDCYYYGDSADDIFLLEKVGHPVAVNPDRGLYSMATARRWTIEKFDSLSKEH